MKELIRIESFGGTDADNDDYLLECFEDHEAFNNLITLKRFLVVGRKGCGKTSIFKKMLKSVNDKTFCVGHTFSDYPWNYHDLQKRIGVPDQDKYTHSWKYFVLLTISKIILNQDSSLPVDGRGLDLMEKIEKFVLDSYGTRDPDLTQIFTPSKRLKFKPTFNFEVPGLRVGADTESVPMSELPVIIQEVNKNLTDYVMDCLNPEHQYFICFDELDLGFNPKDPEYYNRLIGLLLAARDLNISAKQKGRKLFICIFLRNDIYDKLQFEDKNKITENNVSLIEWDTERTQKTLKSLMEKRFTKLLSDRLGENISWDFVFDESKKMPGKQSKYDYLLDRTYLRPRDVIKFSNEILKQYVLRKRGSGVVAEEDSDKFINADIHQAKSEYGIYFLKELDDEIHKHIPDYKEYLEIFKSIQSIQFDKGKFLSVFEAQKSLLPKVQNPVNILREFFEFSVVGFIKKGGFGGGSGYIFKYEKPNARFDEGADQFKLHLGLVDVLELKLWTKS